MLHLDGGILLNTYVTLKKNKDVTRADDPMQKNN